MLQTDAKSKLNQSWVENELDKMNSASQLRDPTKTSKPSVQDSNLNLSLSLGKTTQTYPHISQKIVFSFVLIQLVYNRTLKN